MVWCETEQIQQIPCVCLISYLYKSLYLHCLLCKNQHLFCFVTPALLVCQCYISSDGHPLSCHGSALQDKRVRLRQQALKATMK